MILQPLPELVPENISATRDALHTYSKILGVWTSTCRKRRKHWWHKSLRTSLNGLTTGVIFTNQLNFEIELDFRQSRLQVSTSTNDVLVIDLHGQAMAEPAKQIKTYLRDVGLAEELINAATDSKAPEGTIKFAEYSAAQANKLGLAFAAIAASLASFRAGIREETSPIQVWPHHFDLAMLWLPGAKIPGQDPNDEENADKQMNFGFVFGDSGIAEPYFYVTAYPLPDGLSDIELPPGTQWQSQGFTGAVLTYRQLRQEQDPGAYLLSLWQSLIAAGRAGFDQQQV